jgi:hypothetical protein
LPGLSARKIVIQIRQTFHFADVRMIHSQPLFGIAPLANPVDGVGHDIFDFQNLAIFDEFDSFLDAKLSM